MQSIAALPALPCANSEPKPEIVDQNGGQPYVVYASDLEVDSSALQSAPCNGAPLPISGEIPAAPQPIPAQPEVDQNQPKKPCKVEKNTETVKEAGETIIHKPGPIYVNQPPTRVLIHHAPLIVRPAPVVLNQGEKTIHNHITRQYMPREIKDRHVYIRLVKPIEKKILISKPGPNQPGPNQPGSPDSGAPCDYPSAPLPPLPPCALPAPPAPPAPSAPACNCSPALDDQQYIEGELVGEVPVGSEWIDGADVEIAPPCNQCSK